MGSRLSADLKRARLVDFRGNVFYLCFPLLMLVVKHHPSLVNAGHGGLMAGDANSPYQLTKYRRLSSF